MTHVGTLNNEDIINFCNEGKLITDNFSVKNVKQACYELTASNIYYDISNAHQKHTLKEDDEYILIKPKQIVVILTEESLYLPNDMLGRILTKGKLFSIGLLPVNTYADPGFRGKLGIVFSNISNNYLKITPGDAIAKIEFSKLEEAVTIPYSGQHGYETGVWPVPTEYIMSSEEIKSDKRIKDKSTEIELSFGKNFSGVIKRIEKYERRFLLATISYLSITLILIGLFSGTEWLSTIATVAIGLGVNIIYGIITYFLTKN